MKFLLDKLCDILIFALFRMEVIFCSKEMNFDEP